MRLALEIERDGRTEALEVGLELSDPSDVARVAALVGSEPINDLVRGDWNPVAARAILYVNLLRAMDPEIDWADPPFTFAEMALDWGDLTPYLDVDPEIESTLADLSERMP